MQYVRSLDTTCYSNIIILQSPLSPASRSAILCVHRQHPAPRQPPPLPRACVCVRARVYDVKYLSISPLRPSLPLPPSRPLRAWSSGGNSCSMYAHSNMIIMQLPCLLPPVRRSCVNNPHQDKSRARAFACTRARVCMCVRRACIRCTMSFSFVPPSLPCGCGGPASPSLLLFFSLSLAR